MVHLLPRGEDQEASQGNGQEEGPCSQEIHGDGQFQHFPGAAVGRVSAWLSRDLI